MLAGRDEGRVLGRARPEIACDHRRIEIDRRPLPAGATAALVAISVACGYIATQGAVSATVLWPDRGRRRGDSGVERLEVLCLEPRRA